ncbi:hypothetical protein D9M71_389820 [compost metagenome]
MPRVDPRRQREVAASPAFGEVQLLNGLFVVTDQRKVFGASLMQADDIARQAARLGNLIPHVRIIRAGLEQAFEGFLRIRSTVLLEQQVDADLVQRVVARVLAHQPVNPGLGIRQAIIGDIQIDLSQVVDDFVG